MLRKFKNWLKKCKPLVIFVRLVKGAGRRSPLVYHCRDWTMNSVIYIMLQLMVTPYYLVKWFIGGKNVPGREGLAFVLIAKNEATYIKEWLDFHIKQGVSRFIIYDNESTDNFCEVLRPYIDAGIVLYETIKGKCRQNDAYNMALDKYGESFKYMGFVDADEFVFVRNITGGGGVGSLYSFVDEFMTAHPNAGGLAINWCMFGSNGHKKRPAGGVLENFTRRAEDNFSCNRHVKTICDPTKTLSGTNHNPVYYKDFYSLNENGDIVYSAFSEEVSFSKVRINHYFDKSREEFLIKKDVRGDVNNWIRTMRDFEAYDQNVIHDTEILSHI